MNTFIETSKAPSSRRGLAISPIGAARHAPSRVRRQHPPALRSGNTPLCDPRRDLQMFDLRPAPTHPRRTSVGPRADVPEPRRVNASSGACPWASVGSRDVEPRTVATQPDVNGSAGAASGVRLTTRGYKLLLGLVAGGIVLCSAATVSGEEPVPPVVSTQVVARGGESVEAIAERAADGRDVATVVQLIRSANGIEPGEQLRAGEVVLVPGS